MQNSQPKITAFKLANGRVVSPAIAERAFGREACYNPQHPNYVGLHGIRALYDEEGEFELAHHCSACGVHEQHPNFAYHICILPNSGNPKSETY